LDAPVSGGVAGAERGSLTIMVGGPRPLFNCYYSLFEAMGKTIHYVGDTGAGHTIKAINNMVSATTMAVTSEALALAVKAGINVETALAVINSGTGRSWSSEYKFPTFVLNHAFNSGFSIGLMRKDVDIAIELGQEHAVPLFVAAAAQQLYRFAIGHGLGEQCHTTIATILEEMAGVRLDGTHEVIAEWRDSSGGGAF
jgi:3-hydroxyisobutyrate dehydrogenase-like beta-hydroxyacid dehydrogenase